MHFTRMPPPPQREQRHHGCIAFPAAQTPPPRRRNPAGAQAARVGCAGASPRRARPRPKRRRERDWPRIAARGRPRARQRQGEGETFGTVLNRLGDRMRISVPAMGGPQVPRDSPPERADAEGRERPPRTRTNQGPRAPWRGPQESRPAVVGPKGWVRVSRRGGPWTPDVPSGSPAGSARQARDAATIPRRPGRRCARRNQAPARAGPARRGLERRTEGRR